MRSFEYYTSDGEKRTFKAQQKLYSCSAVEDLFTRYVENGGEILEIEPGSLGYGLTICYGEGLKTAVIKEVYVNPWSSGHTVRFYNEMPKKYSEMIEKYYDESED